MIARGQQTVLSRVGRRMPCLAVLLLTACEGNQAALNPAGPQAGRIAGLSWFMIISLSIVYLIVLAILLTSIFRRRRVQSDAEERRLGRWVIIGVGVTAAYLVALMVLDVSVGRGLSDLSRNEDVLVVDVIGHQWWWEIVYPAQDPSRTITTANELHIPVGRTIRIRTKSVDVIHSFWIPRLHGKRDMIPDHPSDIHIRADQPGTFRGQCAEFCGLQHARMALLVIAQPEAEFRAWQAAQMLPAEAPTDSVRREGLATFLSSTCPVCHTIRGTPAAARNGPDLTHLASRRTIAAGSLPNTRGHLGGWIIDPHHIKPGVNMPRTRIPADRLEPLLYYLDGLK